MRCGIEFEYLIVDRDGPLPSRVRDFGNLDFAWIEGVLADKPGRRDPALATGDLGIKSGYWYLEGDERFAPDGRFRRLEVKGVEIRTPPAPDVAAAVSALLAVEARLDATLAGHGLGLAVAGFNPTRAAYAFEPPLNPWEQALRRRVPAYAGAEVSTLSYGPDINLSGPGWSPARSLDAARKLNAYAPWLVPFSFSSPFHAGAPWGGPSRRSLLRPRLRPAVKLFLPAEQRAALATPSPLVHPPRLASEAGRIEFKAFDAIPSAALLRACCQLLVGVCLSPELALRSETADLALYEGGARHGFADPAVRAGAARVLAAAGRALAANGHDPAELAPLEQLLAAALTPADAMLAAWRDGGPMYVPGGCGGIRAGPARAPQPA